MDKLELGITDLTYNDEFFEYHGSISVAGNSIDLHFLLEVPTTESDLLTRHHGLIALIRSRTEWLKQQVTSRLKEGEDLPDLCTLIIYSDTFDLQFGDSSLDNTKLWYEAMYDNTGRLYHFEKHPHVGPAGN